MKIKILLIISMLWSSQPTFAGTRIACSGAAGASFAKPRVSAQHMAAVVCEGVKKNAVKSEAEGWFNQCGVGGRDGFSASWEDMKSFAGFIGVKVPTYLYNAGKAAVVGAYKGVKNYFTGPDPAKQVQTQARKDAQASQSMLQSLYEKWKAAKALLNAFLDELDYNASLVGTTIECLPWDWKMRYICQFIQQVCLNAVSLGGVASAGNKTVAAASAVAKFNKETKLIEGLKNLPIAQRLSAAADALKKASEYKVFMKAGDSNILVRTDAITKKPRYYIEKYATVNGKKVKEMVEIPKDAKTGAFDANFESGRAMAQAVARSSDKKFLVFADVMDLGKANYFKAGTQSGDLYLQRVAAAMKDSMREGDMLFKNGGDELVVVLNTTDPNAVMNFQKRVHAAIAKDTQLQKMFSDNIAQKAKAVQRGGLPTPNELLALQEAARVRPGVAMGAARIKSGDASPWGNALADADKQAGVAKAQAKANRGADTSKYGTGVKPTTARPQYNAPIPVYKPVE